MTTERLEPKSDASSSSWPPGLIRAIAVSTFWTSLAMFVGCAVGVGMLMDGVDGLAIGGMSAVWGGPGFGLLVGSAVHLLHEERADAENKPEQT